MTLDAVGGVWRYAIDLAAGLKAAGVGIVLVGQGPLPSPAQRREADAIGRLRWLAEPLDWMAAGPEDLAGIGPALARLAREEDADLLHLNLPSQACALNTDRPVVVVSHSCVPTWFRAVRNGGACPEGWAWHQRLNAAGLARAAHVLAPSESHAGMLQACYGPLPALRVVHNGAAEAARAGVERQPFAFAAARWWDDGKNGAVLDAAAAFSPWTVRLAGPLEGPGGERLVVSHAESLGSATHEEVRRLMSEAGLFVSPSLYEPFGLAALEAAQAGTPMVLADIPTYRELWAGVALFADPGSPQAFVAAIGRLADDPALRSELGRQAKARARRFSLDAQRRAMLDVYRSAMAAARHASPMAAAQ